MEPPNISWVLENSPHGGGDLPYLVLRTMRTDRLVILLDKDPLRETASPSRTHLKSTVFAIKLHSLRARPAVALRRHLSSGCPMVLVHVVLATIQACGRNSSVWYNLRRSATVSRYPPPVSNPTAHGNRRNENRNTCVPENDNKQGVLPPMH